MNKAEFLNELEKRIRVLEKNEIKDILGEYSQHIDMRIQSGLSESDAIKDFGSIDELTAEILEAYHVNPEYERESDPQEIFNKESKDAEKRRSYKSISGIFVVIWAWIKKLFNAAVNVIKDLFNKIKVLIIKMFNWLKNKDNVKKLSEKASFIKPQSSTKQKMKNVKVKYKSTKEFCKGAFKRVLHICLIIIVMLCLLPVAAVSIFSVFTVGFTITFLIQGYPVMGIFIMLLGLSICSISVSGLLLSLIVKTKKNDTEIYELEDNDGTDDTTDFEETCREDEYK